VSKKSVEAAPFPFFYHFSIAFSSRGSNERLYESQTLLRGSVSPALGAIEGVSRPAKSDLSDEALA
jgi:hypothetical protein